MGEIANKTCCRRLLLMQKKKRKSSSSLIRETFIFSFSLLPLSLICMVSGPCPFIVIFSWVTYIGFSGINHNRRLGNFFFPSYNFCFITKMCFRMSDEILAKWDGKAWKFCRAWMFEHEYSKTSFLSELENIGSGKLIFDDFIRVNVITFEKPYDYRRFRDGIIWLIKTFSLTESYF